MTTTPATSPAVRAADCDLIATLRVGKAGPRIGQEPVTDNDLTAPLGELWMDHFLRKGHLDVDLDDLSVRVVPVFDDISADLCKGIRLQTTDPAGQVVSSDFTIYAFDHVADRGTARLAAAKKIEIKDAGNIYYNITARRRTARPAAKPAVALTVKRQRRALSVLKVPIAPLRAEGEPIGPVDDKKAYPVFYTAGALARAERLSRKGAKQDPPIESGALLIGPLCSCPETGELFSVVCDAIEVRDAEQTTFSLGYTPETWQRIDAVMHARQSTPANRGDRILGQCHGHPFLPPHEGTSCETCPDRDKCKLTSVFVSTLDLTWSRATFANQPWQLCHIFGLSARGSRVHGLFGQADGRLLHRGFYYLPETDGEKLRDLQQPEQQTP